ncbi:MAG TPA: GMC family oxidoreductase [Bryobacteraceae bacterium]|jgi:choline dehydrogenase-like flavoprotein|nr:GMC family oxidoreductase [Bryobacteraceae bacterium]
MFQVSRTPQAFDVVVIGSGAGGGTAVKVLTDAGIRVALLEAGPMLTPEKDFKEHVWPYQVDHRGAGSHGEAYFGRQQWGYFSAPNGYWDVPGEPYTVAPGEEWKWFRSRILGGRTNHYGRISLRFSDYDFKPEDGLSDPWPVTYDEMSPYYDKAEGFIGVTGTKEGLRTAPDGNFLPPIAPRVHEQLIQKAGKKLNIPVIPSRMAMLTKAVNGRAACHYCGQCGRGCLTASAFSSSQAMIFPAMKTGKLTVITGAMARELITDGSGKVTAVSYVDKATRTEKQIRCRAVMVAASACESARLLLNSKSPRFSNGLANSGGAVGRYLTDSVGYAMGGHVPAMEGMPRHNSDGIGGMHVYVPWWLHDDKSKDFPRGYHIEIGGGPGGIPQLGTFAGVCSQYQGYGQQLKDQIYQNFGAQVHFAGRGEMIPNKNSYCEIDPDRVDQFGIPVLRFHFKWSDAEYNQVKHMHQTFSAMIETLGGTVSKRPFDSTKEISAGGFIIHEAGAVRMGADPKTSALNKYCQAHDVKNLFVCDAAPFVSQPDKNVTLSIVAFAWRASEYLAEEMRKGNV